MNCGVKGSTYLQNLLYFLLLLLDVDYKKLNFEVKKLQLAPRIVIEEDRFETKTYPNLNAALILFFHGLLMICTTYLLL